RDHGVELRNATGSSGLASRGRNSDIGRPMSAARPTDSGRRFVIVDDSATYRELVREALTRRHPNLIFEAHALGREGIAACVAAPPDLLIVDLYLHDMDGRDIVRELRHRGI